uniref:Cna B-type domain-containing protein n=1 Tax=Methanobrevibacter sp. TaxID=66852 RepID=UPI00388F801F
MRFKRCMFLTLILFLTMFSVSFVGASENVAYDQNTGELNTLGMSDASPIEGTSNTLAVDSVAVDSADDDSLGTASEENEIEINDSKDNETKLLQSSNDVEIDDDENLEILSAEKDFEILGANDEPVLGADQTPRGNSMQDVMDAIIRCSESNGGTVYLNGGTYYGGATLTAGQSTFPDQQWITIPDNYRIENVRIVGGSRDRPNDIATFIPDSQEGIALAFRGQSGSRYNYYRSSSGFNLVNVTFENLRSTGRMFSFGSGSLTDVVFNNLESYQHLFFLYGCHDDSQPITLTNCNFTNCKQTYTGGGNHNMDDTTGQLGVLFGAKLERCNFINTSSANHGGAFCISDEYSHPTQGGAERVASSLTDCNFINVTSRWFAVYIHGNYTGEGDYQHDFITEPQVIDNCNFINCTSTGEYGGALGISHNDVIIRNTNFTNNTGGEGAAIMVGGILYHHDAFLGYNIEGNNMTIENCTFKNNRARTENQIGTETNAGPSYPNGNAGAVFVYGNNTKIINTVFENNTAANNGAAMYIHGSGTIVENSTLTGNSAVNGTVYIEGSNTKITNSNFFNNTAENGAGAYVEGANTQITDSEASYNTAVCNGDPEHSGLGAGFHIIGDNAVFSNITSKNNTADSEGGSIYVIGENTLVEDSLFAYNTAPVGGAMSIDGSDAKFFNNTIINNTAVPNEVRDTDNSGGAIYISGDRTNFTSNNISNNFAKDNGGALYVDGTNTYFDDIYADNNNALNGGFAQLLGANNLIVQNSTFTNNHATGDSLEDNIGEGGAFHISDSQNANIQGYFVNNTAINGSAIYVENSSLHIEDSAFFDNQAATHLLDIYPPDKTKFEPGDEMIITISHIGGDNIANAIHDHARSSNITVNNISYLFYHNGTEYIKTTPDDHDVVPVYGWENSNDGEDLYEDDKENNQVIYYTVRNTLTGEILNDSYIRTDIDGTIKLNLTGLAVGFYEVIGTYLETPYYTAAYNFTALFGVEGLNLTINKTVDQSPVYVNDTVVFTINVTNNGPFNATDVKVNDVVPSQFKVIGCNDTGYDNSTGILIIDQLNVGDSYAFTITAIALVNGTWTNNASANCKENETVVWDDATVVVLPLKDINVTKIWDDDDDRDRLRPDNITVVLLADTVEINQTVLSDDNNWTYIFYSLPVTTLDGTEIEYKIKEFEVEDYNVTVTRNNYAFIINNTYVPKLTEVNVTKVWDDDNNRDGVRPKNVTVVLLKDGVENASAVLSEDNNWKHTFSKLYVNENGTKIVYSFKELDLGDEYTVVIENSSAYIYSITNTHVPNRTSVNVTKVWDDNNNRDGIRPKNITVVLLKDGVENATAVLSDDNDWKHTFSNLLVYENGKKIVYSFKELDLGREYTVVIENSTAYIYTITNTHVPNRTSVRVTKVWDDDNNRDGIRPKNITVVLLKDGVENATAVLSQNNNWRHTFSNLLIYEDGREIVYSFKELDLGSEYTVVIKNSSAYIYTITNTHVPNRTSVNVAKVWMDADDHDGLRPKNITVVLLKDGVENATAVLSDDNDWKHTFSNLLVYENGKKIVYSFKELDLGSEYTVVITNSTAYDFIITNTHDIVVDLGINKTVDKPVVYVNDTVVFTINVTNNGPSIATNVTIKDVVPVQFKVTGSNDTAYINNQLLVSKLNVGESYAFTITAVALVNGTWINIANVTCNENKTVKEDNATVVVKPVVNLTIDKTVDNDHVFVEAPVVFTIDVTNEGPCNATNVVITDVVPEQFKVTGYSEGYDIETNTITVPLLVVGEHFVFTINATTLVNGTWNNTANVTCEENRTVKNDTVVVKVDPVVNLTIDKSV